MFCPRCGRTVSDAANFCGGCGLPKVEILRLNAEKEQAEKQQNTATTQAENTTVIGETLHTVEPVKEVDTQENIVEILSEINEIMPEVVCDNVACEKVEVQSTTTQTQDESQPQVTTTTISSYTKETYKDDNSASNTITNNTQEGVISYNQAWSENCKQSAQSGANPISYNQAYENMSSSPEDKASYKYQQPKQTSEMTTVDFIWTIILCVLPVIGLFYTIYLAFVQDKNIIKRNYARAVLILSAFCIAVFVMFFAGFIFSFF